MPNLTTADATVNTLYDRCSCVPEWPLCERCARLAETKATVQDADSVAPQTPENSEQAVQEAMSKARDTVRAVVKREAEGQNPVDANLIFLAGMSQPETFEWLRQRSIRLTQVEEELAALKKRCSCGANDACDKCPDVGQTPENFQKGGS